MPLKIRRYRYRGHHAQGEITVVSLPGHPSYRAGLRTGDHRGINDITEPMSLNEGRYDAAPATGSSYRLRDAEVFDGNHQDQREVQ